MNDISRARDEFLESADRYPEAFRRQVGSASRRGFLAAGVGVGAAGLLGACSTKTKKSSEGGSTGSTVAAGGSGSPAAAGSSASPSAPEGKAGTDKSDTEKVVNFSNWVSYIDVDENDKNKHPTLDG